MLFLAFIQAYKFQLLNLRVSHLIKLTNQPILLIQI